MDEKTKKDILDSAKMSLSESMTRTDSLALHFIKISAGFAQAYPEEAAEYAELYRQEQAVEEEKKDVMRQWELRFGESVNTGDEVDYHEDTYTVLQPHTISAEWCPPDVPALYRKKSTEEWPEWKQPTGAADAYKKGDKVTFESEHYISLIDGNVWSPSAYPAGWSKQNG